MFSLFWAKPITLQFTAPISGTGHDLALAKVHTGIPTHAYLLLPFTAAIFCFYS
jgi:hypothetical protein